MIDSKDNSPKLPVSWMWTSIDQIGDVTKLAGFEFTNYFKYQESAAVRVVRGLNIGVGKFKVEGFKYIDISISNSLPRSQLQPGDLLINYVGTLGRVAILPDDSNRYHLGPNVGKITIEKQIGSANYLLFFLLSPLGQASIHQTSKAVAQSSLSMKQIRSLPVPLAPLNEQRRIVAKIEALKARSQQVKKVLEAIPLLLDQFRQSVLAAAFRGDLTADWREKNPDVEYASKVVENIRFKRLNQASTLAQIQKVNEIYSDKEEEELDLLPESWRYITLEKLCDSFQYGTSTKSLPSGQFFVLRMGNIQNGEIDWNDIVYTCDEKEIEKYRLKPGDVLFNRTNSPELVGKTGIYRGEYPAIFAGYLIKINNYQELDSEYLNYCLNTNYAKDYCWRVKTDGVSQSNINAQKLAKFEIPFCSIEEQQEIVRRIKSLLKVANRIKQEYQEANAYVDQLDQSILAKAFRGELVPQDPNDEPASVLLERIRAERAKREAEAKAVKKSTGKITGRRSRKAKQQDSESNQLELPGLE